VVNPTSNASQTERNIKHHKPEDSDTAVSDVRNALCTTDWARCNVPPKHIERL